MEADRPASARERSRVGGALRIAAVLGLYLALACAYTWPLLPNRADHIASDPYDPILNTSILWWNAKTIPFSPTWWNPPYFHPTRDVSALTENLQGLTPISTPIYWITGNPLTTYNLVFFLTWPLSAFTAFLFVRFVTRRDDAAILAGAAYGFTPYRLAELGHLQMVATCWVPLVLLGLHGYLERRTVGWLALFGVAWLLQSLANGYMMLFGGVLVTLWLAYFCSTRRTWRAGAAIVVAWTVASLPLLPVFLKYKSVHEYNGLRRNLYDAIGVSAPLSAWLEVSPLSTVWRHILPGYNDDLFPGITAAALVLCAAVALTRRSGTEWRSYGGRGLRRTVEFLLAGAIALILVTSLVGPWRVEVAGIVIRMSRLGRPLVILVVFGIAWVVRSTTWRLAWQRRSPLLFYGVATVVMAIFAAGKVLRIGERILVEPAPYAWLLYLPGFTGLRVPMRFWMLGVLCLATAAGLAFARLATGGRDRRRLLFGFVAIGLVVDGWIGPMPMSNAPGMRPRVERRDSKIPVLEMPLGPAYDAAATIRSIWHGRPTFNGVSGYDPSHYAPLQSGLDAHDPTMLAALVSLGPLDVVIDGAEDHDGAWTRYVSGFPGAERIASDGLRTTYRLPAGPNPDAVVGPIVPIVGISAFRHDAAVIVDGRIETEWGDDPQRPEQWISADLGAPHEVGGITHAMGEYARDFPRHLVIDTSLDGTTWEAGWEGSTAGLAFLAAVRGPREAAMHIAFAPRQARFVRLRQLAHHKNMWRIAELTVHGR